MEADNQNEKDIFDEMRGTGLDEIRDIGLDEVLD